MKEIFINEYTRLIDKNHEGLSEYFNHKPHHFLALTSLRNEILQNLLLDLNQTAIFGINHFLERMIKLSLIEKHTLGLNYSNHELYNEKTIEAVQLYDKLVLHDSLQKANEQGLITDDERTILDNYRKTIRNPFSHAEIKKIMTDAPPKFEALMFNINDLKKSLIAGEPIKGGERKEITTLSSALSQLYQREFSSQVALSYFLTVYRILQNIDKKLLEMNKSC